MPLANTTHNMFTLLDRAVATLTEQIGRGVELCRLRRSVRVMADSTIPHRYRAMDKGVLLEFNNLIGVALATQDQFRLGDLPALCRIFTVMAIDTLKNSFRSMYKFLFKHPPVTRCTRVTFSNSTP